MDIYQIQEEIVNVIIEQLGVDPMDVTPEASFVDDLGADSLDTVELVMALEERFDIEIPDEDAEDMKNLAAVVTYVKKTLS